MFTDEQIRTRDLIKEYVHPSRFLPKARRSGLECPFCHNGSNGGRGDGLSPLKKKSKNRWYCWTCKKAYDVIDLIQGHYKVDFDDALDIGAQLGGIVYTAKSSESRYNLTDKPETLTESKISQDRGIAEGKLVGSAPLADADTDKPENFLQNGFYGQSERTLYTRTGKAALKTLLLRGLSVKTLKDFHIGCSYTSGHPSFPIIIPTSEETYTARAVFSSNYHKHGDRMHPMYCLRKDKPNNPIFITEGEINALSLYEIGESAIATGSAKNPHFIEDLLKDGNVSKNRVFILCFDPDETGVRCQADLLAEMQKTGFIVYDVQYLNCNFYKNVKEDVNDILIKDRKDLELRAFYARCTAQQIEEWARAMQLNFPPAENTLSDEEGGVC